MINQIIASSDFFLLQQQFLLWISHYRNTVLDMFFIALTFFGSEYFYMLLIPFLFGWLDRKTACIIISVTLLSLILNTVMKEIFSLPRPPVSLTLPIYQGLAQGYGFPSGHAQGSLTLWGLIAIWNKKRLWIVIGCVVFVLLMALSRLYLGVHYPIDIIGGWGFAALVLLLYISSRKLKFQLPYWIFAVLFFVFAVSLPVLRIEKTCTVLSGIFFGMELGNKYNLEKFYEINFLVRVTGIIITSGLLFIIHKLSHMPYIISYVVIGFWVSFFYQAFMIIVVDKIKTGFAKS